MDKIIELLTKTERNIGEMTSDVKAIMRDNEEIKNALEELKKDSRINIKDIETLKKEIDEHSEKIRKLQEEINTLKESADKYNKFDAKLTRTKRLISYITFDNKFMRVVFSGLIYAILGMLVAMFIDYLSIRFGISKEVVDQLKQGVIK